MTYRTKIETLRADVLLFPGQTMAHPLLRDDAWFSMKEAQGNPVLGARMRRLMDLRARLDPAPDAPMVDLTDLDETAAAIACAAPAVKRAVDRIREERGAAETPLWGFLRFGRGNRA